MSFDSHHHYSQLRNGTCHVQRQEPSCKAYQRNKTSQRVQNSSERSTWQCAHDLHILHRTVCTVLRPDDYTDCYEHAELLQWQWSLLQQALQSVIMIFPHNKPLCVPSAEVRQSWTTWQLPQHITLPPGHLLQTSNPQSNLPTRYTQNSHSPSCFKGCVLNGK